MLRVLHEFNDGAVLDALLPEVARLRDEAGCSTAEVYATMADEDHWALTMVFDTEEVYWGLWGRVIGGEYPALRALADVAETEFYAQALYGVGDGRWEPTEGDETKRKIFWPARGQVRIIIQNAYEPNDRMHELTRAEILETRREPGCVAYAWMENVEVPNHLMLLEVWEDQFIYDQHWFMRSKTVELRGNSGRVAAEPQRGPFVREFYRQQEFQHQYDRWLPAEVDDWSESVTWTAG